MRKKRDKHGIVPGFYEVSGGYDMGGKPHKTLTVVGKEHAKEIYDARVRINRKRRALRRRKK